FSPSSAVALIYIREERTSGKALDLSRILEDASIMCNSWSPRHNVTRTNVYIRQSFIRSDHGNTIT
ncbi:inhibitory POU protein-like, partial [Vespula squamosa]